MSPNAFNPWIARQLRLHPPRAKSLVMTVFGDAIAPRGGSVWLGSLITLLAPLGLSERLVRTSVYRLVEEGWLEASRSGRRSQYRLSPQGEKRFLRAHQRVYANAAPQWDGRWMLISPQGSASAAQKSALKKELLWEGFGHIAPGLYACPGDKQEALAELLARTRMQGKAVVLLATDAGLAGTLPMDTITPAAWPLKDAARTYKKFIARFEALHQLLQSPASLSPASANPAARAGRPDSATAFTLRTLLIHEYRRALLSDPQLPASLLGDDWPGQQAQALCRALYLALEKDAERHVANTLAQEQDEVPPVAPSYASRFRDR